MLHVLVSINPAQALNTGQLKLKTNCTCTELLIYEYIYIYYDISQVLYICILFRILYIMYLMPEQG